uniref:Dynein assembly factor with WD repeat domains 1 n=1 Tax=Sinocyclocheilus grahami TaxID=75366 RepID=A0A672R8A6_SINGR
NRKLYLLVSFHGPELTLMNRTDVNELLSDIRAAEPLITSSCAEQVKVLICRLQEKVGQKDDRKFYLFRVSLSAVLTCLLPLPPSNSASLLYFPSVCSFITGSYDRTCKIWDTASGEELHTLEGHRNVVYAIAFNNPYGMAYPSSFPCFFGNWYKVATGSFDKTCKLWSAETGKCFYTFRGHTAEIIISLSFNTMGDHLVTGSFDHTAILWDVSSGSKVHILTGHRGEISCVQFNWDCSLIVTASLDKTCKVWDADSGQCLATLLGHNDEVLDVCFNYTGQLIATASADGSSRVFSAETFQCLCQLEGHNGEISKVRNPIFSPSSINTFRYTMTDLIQLCAFNADIKTHYYYVTMQRKP